MNIEKLTIEITGKPISPHMRIFADGKHLSQVQNVKISSDVDDIFVSIELLQSKTAEKDGKKETVLEPLILKWGK